MFSHIKPNRPNCTKKRSPILKIFVPIRLPGQFLFFTLQKGLCAIHKNYWYHPKYFNGELLNIKFTSFRKNYLSQAVEKQKESSKQL